MFYPKPETTNSPYLLTDQVPTLLIVDNLTEIDAFHITWSYDSYLFFFACGNKLPCYVLWCRLKRKTFLFWGFFFLPYSHFRTFLHLFYRFPFTCSLAQVWHKVWIASNIYEKPTIKYRLDCTLNISSGQTKSNNFSFNWPNAIQTYSYGITFTFTFILANNIPKSHRLDVSLKKKTHYQTKYFLIIINVWCLYDPHSIVSIRETLLTTSRWQKECLSKVG